jgi:hypothetical protein
VKNTDQAWIVFGKGMAILSGIVFFVIAFWDESNIFSFLLRGWAFFLGGLFIYAAFRV